LTVHATALSVAFVAAAAKLMRCPRRSVADAGETLTLTALVTVTDADALAPVDGTVA
jgi:hypothetical protein